MGGDDPRPTRRSRVGWWLFVAALAAAAAYVAYSFVGMLVAGLFGYYATRPINDRVEEVIDSDAVAAGATVLVVLLPVVLVTLYAGFQIALAAQSLIGGAVDPLSFAAQYFGLGDLPADEREAVRTVIQDPGEFLENPQQTAQTVLERGLTVLSTVASTLLFLALAITLSYFLLKTDDALSDALRELFGGRDTTAYAYATAVDSDLESVFFGNFLFVVVMAVVATAAYWVTNLLLGPALRVPMVPALGFLTGVASLIPVVVGKVVYVPVLAYLALQAVRTEGTPLPAVGGVAVGYFLLLDFLPQTFLQPYISGRDLDATMLLFAYILGPILFGWYGFFLLPILFILMLEAVRIALPELLHGERLTHTATLGDDVGADPQEEGPVPTDEPGESGTGPSSDE
ncbi:AI-2E family transporter [Halosimplex salinum]|uniref:AI-2E family transporter n=1 Tax=Halosimplex salinum TaxID=1710538 RepID=UPI000F49AFC6|nr:AI-2E family transporter [Halosimplex salinum]